MKTPIQIFLAYSMHDEEKVADLYQRLVAEGYAPWMDVKNIIPGERRREAINRAMRNADFFIACLSSNSVDERGFVQSQFKYALSSMQDKLANDIYLIPVRFEACEVPDDFIDLQMADLFRDDGPSQLLRALKEGLERTRGRTALDSQWPQPEQLIASVRPLPEMGIAMSWEEREGREDAVFNVPFRKGRSHLALEMESEHFIIHFGLFNPPTGKTMGADGIRDRALIRTYLNALEICFEVMIAAPWKRQPPIVGPTGKTAVFVIDSASFTSYDLQLVPFICLPSGTNEPTNKAELDRAAAEAVHEAVHIFNYAERPFHDVHSVAWEWFDCALASFVETIVLPENVDHLRFVDNWICRPDHPIDEVDVRNSGFVFIQYLANRIGLDFVNDVWTKSSQTETPWEAIARMLPDGQLFASHEPPHQDIFGSGYCMDSYFLGDKTSKCYMPRAYERYGQRAISESVLLDVNDTRTIADKISHLACKYYCLRLKPAAKQSQVQVSLSHAISAPLKVEAAFVKSNGDRLFVEQLWERVGETTETTRLFTEFSVSASDADHVILVVSNCGTRSSLKTDQHDDDREYKLLISVH